MATERKQLQFVSGPDGGVILDIEADLIATLNPTGAFVWQRLQRGEGVEAIAESLATETGTSRSEIVGDVEHFVDELKVKDLLPL